jgi:uncharacterized protein
MDIIEYQLSFKNNSYDYIYDPFTNLIYPSEFEKHYKHFRKKNHNFQIRFPEKFPSKKDEIESYIGRNNNRLVLDVTQQCNLRCKYCVYNDMYDDRRNYENFHMSEETLKKSLEFYYKLKKDRFTKNFVDISFYGGEPSLLPNIIYKATDIIHSLFGDRKAALAITSNGTFAKNTKLLKHLVDNIFAIHLSLDGDKKQNDEFRIYPTGKGVFDDVMNVLKQTRNYDGIMLQLTLHPKHDWDEINNFFTDLTKDFPKVRLFINYFLLQNYFKPDAAELNKLMLDKKTKFQQYIIDKFENDKELTPFENAFVKYFEKSYNFNYTPHWAKSFFVNTCYPGADKISINSEGKIYICERVEEKYLIGTLEHGFYYDKINQLWKIINKSTKETDCKNCSYQAFCFQCFAALRSENNEIILPCNDNIKNGMLSNIKFMTKVRLHRMSKGEVLKTDINEENC